MEYSESKKKYKWKNMRKSKPLPQHQAKLSTAILKKPLMNGCNGIKVISKILPLFRGAFSVKI